MDMKESTIPIKIFTNTLTKFSPVRDHVQFTHLICLVKYLQKNPLFYLIYVCIVQLPYTQLLCHFIKTQKWYNYQFTLWLEPLQLGLLYAM